MAEKQTKPTTSQRTISEKFREKESAKECLLMISRSPEIVTPTPKK